jgi:hypothetical protein
MVDNYGREKFAELLTTYQQGALPDAGLQRVYGMNQDELENAWRAKIGMPLRDVSVFAMPTLAPKPTFEVSSPLTGDATPTPRLAPTGDPTRISAQATSLPAETVPASEPGLPADGLCGGALALGGLVTVALLHRRKTV